MTKRICFSPTWTDPPTKLKMSTIWVPGEKKSTARITGPQGQHPTGARLVQNGVSTSSKQTHGRASAFQQEKATECLGLAGLPTDRVQSHDVRQDAMFSMAGRNWSKKAKYRSRPSEAPSAVDRHPPTYRTAECHLVACQQRWKQKTTTCAPQRLHLLSLIGLTRGQRGRACSERCSPRTAQEISRDFKTGPALQTTSALAEAVALTPTSPRREASYPLSAATALLFGRTRRVASEASHPQTGREAGSEGPLKRPSSSSASLKRSPSGTYCPPTGP